jgi:hypothetical protein
MSRAARTEQEKAQDDRLDAFMADARSGKAKPKPWQAPRSQLGDFLSRTVSGVDPDAGKPTSQSVYDEAWGRLTEAERVQADPDDPEKVARLGQLVAQVEEERESERYRSLSHRQQLQERGVSEEDIRTVYGNPT